MSMSVLFLFFFLLLSQDTYRRKGRNKQFIMSSLNVDVILGGLFMPPVWGSVLLVTLYTAPVWIGRAVVIWTALSMAMSYLNTKYKQRGQWEQLSEKDTAVITGGSNGLGLEITKLLRQRRVKCVILDKEEISDHLLETSVEYYQCDLADEEQVMSTINKIKSRNTPTILINNAAARHSEGIKHLSVSKMINIMSVNTLAPAILMKELLGSNSRLYVVNISSVLGVASPANLSFYSASKAALTSLHESISHEFSKQLNKRFLLVAPGQLDTRMFKDVKPPKQFLAPVIHARTLAQDIVRHIDSGERGTIHGQVYTYFIPLLKMLPYGLNEFARWYSEMDESVVDEEED